MTLMYENISLSIRNSVRDHLEKTKRYPDFVVLDISNDELSTFLASYFLSNVAPFLITGVKKNLRAAIDDFLYWLITGKSKHSDYKAMPWIEVQRFVANAQISRLIPVDGVLIRFYLESEIEILKESDCE